MLREGVERFPAAFLDQDAAEIRLLCDHREVLVNERTRLINRDIRPYLTPGGQSEPSIAHR